MGYCEFGTVIGVRHKGAIVTVVERKSVYGFIANVTNRASELVRSAIVDKLKPMAARVKTQTVDNGREFTAHAHIDKQHQSTTNFARPFARWERGSNENTNGLVSQYLPKGKDLSVYSCEQLDAIAK